MVVIIYSSGGLRTHTCWDTPTSTHTHTHTHTHTPTPHTHRISREQPDKEVQHLLPWLSLQHFAPRCKLFREYLPLVKHRCDATHCNGNVVQVGFVTDSNSEILKRRKCSMERTVRLKDFDRSVVVRRFSTRVQFTFQ